MAASGLTGRLDELVNNLPEPQLAQAVGWLQQTDSPCYLVGGTVRDSLLNTTAHFAPARRPGRLQGQTPNPTAHHDLDFAVPADARRLARRLADALDAAYYPLDDTRDVGRIVIQPEGEDTRYVIDIARFQGDTLEADLRGRDFTLNAMAVDIQSLPPKLLDPTGGRLDLRAGLLRAAGDTAIQDDPVRALRAIRFRAQFGFQIETYTRTLITRSILGLHSVSAERVRDELNKTFCLADVIDSLYELDSLGLLCVLFPELLEEKGVTPLGCHQWDVFSHSLETVGMLEDMLPLCTTPGEAGVPFADMVADHVSQMLPGGVSRRTLLTWAALFHELGQPHVSENRRRKPAAPGDLSDSGADGHTQPTAELASTILQRLHFSKPAIRMVDAALRSHTTPLHLAIEGPVNNRTAHRFFRHGGAAGVEAVLLALADNQAIIVPGNQTKEWPALLSTADFLLDAYFNHKESVISPPPLLVGSDLINQFGLKPGPQLGRMLAALAEAQAAGEVHDPGQARQWVTQQLGQTQ